MPIRTLLTNGASAPITEKDRLEGIISYQEEELKNEIYRGNYLCEIIYSLMENNGPKALTKGQKETVLRIKRNIEHAQKHPSTGTKA